MSGEDLGALAGRIHPEPAPREGQPEPSFDEMLENALHELGAPGPETPAPVTSAIEWIQKARAKLERVGAVVDRATIADVQAAAGRLELIYIPEQHRLHAAPKEECNVDDSMTKTKISEDKLSKVDPDVILCKHCVSPEEARLIRLAIRRA